MFWNCVIWTVLATAVYFGICLTVGAFIFTGLGDEIEDLGGSRDRNT